MTTLTTAPLGENMVKVAIFALLISYSVSVNAQKGCNLSESDYESLASIDDRYTREEILAFPPEQKTALCTARYVVRMNREGRAESLTANDVFANGIEDFITEKEFDEISSLMEGLFEDMWKTASHTYLQK